MEWIYVLTGLLIIALISGILTSCSVVKTNYSSEAKKNATVYYYLPESILKIKTIAKIAVIYNGDDSTLNASSRIVEQSFTTTTEMIADTKNLLSLNYTPSMLMADEIKYAVNSKGLLETVNVTTDDRISEIVSKLTQAPAVVLGTSTGATKAPNTVVKIKEYTADFAVKASAVSGTGLIIGWNLIVTNELGKDEFLTINADFKISSLDITSGTSLPSLINGTNVSKKNEISGILTRPLKNIELKIESANTGLNNSLSTNVNVSDVSKLIVVPVNRTVFVKRVNKIGIQDGIITSHEINKPSSVEGFISIPVNVAKAVVSIPAQLIQFRFDNTKRMEELETAKLTYEKAIVENQKYALTKEQEIEKIKLEAQKADMTNDIELQKLKFELQKSLLEAEKKQLEAEKELITIKKELEELKKKK